MLVRGESIAYVAAMAAGSSLKELGTTAPALLVLVLVLVVVVVVIVGVLVLVVVLLLIITLVLPLVLGSLTWLR